MKTERDLEKILNDIAFDQRRDQDGLEYEFSVLGVMKTLEPTELSHFIRILDGQIRSGTRVISHMRVLGDLGNLNWFPQKYDPIRAQAAECIVTRLQPAEEDVDDLVLETLLRLRCRQALAPALDRIEKRQLIDSDGIVAALVHIDHDNFLRFSSELFGAGLNPNSYDKRVEAVIPRFLFSILDENQENARQLLRKIIEETSKRNSEAGRILNDELKDFVKRNPGLVNERVSNSEFIASVFDEH